MAGRGPQTFKKRQKEQQRKEKQEEKRARRFQRLRDGLPPEEDSPDDNLEMDGLDDDEIILADGRPLSADRSEPIATPSPEGTRSAQP